MRVLTCSLLACVLWGAVVPPADARLGDSVTVARELARRKGAKSVKLYCSHPYPESPLARVIAETWVAPDEGWNLEEANSYLKLIVGSRRRLMVKTSRVELGWVYSFRYQDHVTARCIYEGGLVREITAYGANYVENDAVEEKAITFVFPTDPTVPTP